MEVHEEKLTKWNSNTQEKIDTSKNFMQLYKLKLTTYEVYDEDIEKLFKSIDEDDREIYWLDALLWLLSDLQSTKYITEKFIIDEINALKKQNNKQEQVDTEEEQIDTKHINIQTTFLETKMDYHFLDNRDKASPQELQTFKDNYLTSEITEKLKIANINIDDYVAFWYAAEQISKESGELTEEQITFVNQFNNFNRTLDIDYQITIPVDKLRNTPKPNNLADIIKTPDAVFAYPSIREYTSTQPNIINKATERIDINPKLQQDIWTELSPKQQQEIQEAIKKNCIDNKLLTPTDFSYTTTIDIQLLLRSSETIDDDIKKDIQHIIDNILWSYTQDYLISQTNAQAKQLIITQAIAGLARYFDTTTGPTENYASDFDLTKEWNISIENNVLHISWQMHGQIVHFFYNLQTGELQANDYLYKVIKAESFLINDIDQWRYTLPNALPTITDLEKTMKNIDYTNMMQNNTSLHNFQTTIRKQSDTIKEKFSTQTYNKLYITRTNEKNLFIQETLDGIGWQSRLLKIAGRSMTIDNTSNPVEITRSLHPNEYELLLLLDRTSQAHRSPEQLRDMRNSINRRKQAIQDPRIANGTHNDPVINKLFNQQALLEDTENRNNPSKKSNFLLFLDLVSNPQSQFWWGILDTNLLEKIIRRIENNQPIAMLENPRSLDYANDPRYFNEKYEKILHENL